MSLKSNRKVIVSLMLALVYQILIELIKPAGLSIANFLIALFVWSSCFLTISTFYSHYRIIKNIFPIYAFYLFLIIVSWNILCILRSAIEDIGSITTQFGNAYSSLALLAPFFIIFSVEKDNLRNLYNFLAQLIFIGIPAYLLYFFAFGETNNETYNNAYLILFYGTVFLIPLIPFQIPQKKILILFGSLFLFYLAILTDTRIMFVRIIGLYMAVLTIFLYDRYRMKVILFVAFLTLTLPFYFIVESTESGQSAFEKYLPEAGNEDLSVDTRTFLYMEVFQDLEQNNSLLFGKGSNGSYFSAYFVEEEGDSSNRLSVEVGVLAMLLKGGIVSVLLNLILLFIAIYLAFFRSNNLFILSIGLMLLIHTLLLFIENPLSYSVYNLILWFFIGVCFSKEIRLMEDNEIKNILI
jgi:hypothetical protein